MLIAFAALLAQTPFYGDIPQDVPTFILEFADGSTDHGALWLQDDWNREESVSSAAGQRPTIIYDTPWNPRTDRMLRLPEFTLEPPALRKSRLEREWDAAGYGPADTPDGVKYYPKEEIELAERARDMAAKLAESNDDSGSAAAPAAVQRQGGFLDEWGLHAVAAIIGIIVTGLVFRKMVLDYL